MNPLPPPPPPSARPPLSPESLDPRHVQSTAVRELTPEHSPYSDDTPTGTPVPSTSGQPSLNALAMAVDPLGRRRADHPLCVGPSAHQTIIGTPTLGRLTPSPATFISASVLSQHPSPSSNRGEDADGVVPVTSDAYAPVAPMKGHSVIVTAGKRYQPVADDRVRNLSFRPFGDSFGERLSRHPSLLYKSDSPPLGSVRNGSVQGRLDGVEIRIGASGDPRESPNSGRREGKEGVGGSSLATYLRADQGVEVPIAANDPINNYTFFVAGAESEDSTSSASSVNDDAVDVDVQHRPENHNPFGASPQSSMGADSFQGPKSGSSADHSVTPKQMKTEDAERFVETLKRSFAMQRQRSTTTGTVATGAQSSCGELSHEPTFQNDMNPLDALRRSMAMSGLGGGGSGGPSNPNLLVDEEKAAANYMRQPMHEALSCVSRHNLEDDSVSLKAVYEGFLSETLSRNITFGFRVTLLSIFPAFLLAEHPTTKGWFVSGALLPIIAGLFSRPTLGEQMMMITMGLQTAAFLMMWGVTMNAVGASHNMAGWWCGVIFVLFGASLLGELRSKRLLMVWGMMVMQLEHNPGGDALVFPCYFALDFIIAMGLACAACVLPFPTLSRQKANEAIAGLHKLQTAGVGNAMKSFWAPVPLDARLALTQIPFAKISGLMMAARMAIAFTSYEPSEFNLHNLLRGQRLAILQRIKMHLYAMYAASSQRLEGTRDIHRSQIRHEIKEFEKRLQVPAMELAGEVMKVLAQVGAYIDPKELLEKVSFDAMAEKALIFSDFIEHERMEMLYLRKLPAEETNTCLRCFAFHSSLIDIAGELQKLETAMKTFDPSKYPSLFQRAFNFFFLDLWNAFWEELPYRLTLARPYDVRLVKDGIRYTGAFATACAFTLNYDKNNIYYFGMAILMRLAQQTAAETIIIGVNRICGLCIGASLAYITEQKTHNVAELTLLTMTWAFIAMCFSQHPSYGAAAQYVLVTSIAGLRLAPSPTLLLTRVTDNVFAFISYYIICVLIFPVDPIRMLWNTRTKCFLSMNDLGQILVSIGSAPITMGGQETDFLINKARAAVAAQQLLLKTYAEWMVKAQTEPTVRGGDYPTVASNRLRITFNEIMSLQEALLNSFTRLQRPREQPPSMVLRDMMELTRPFLLDAGRLMHHVFQNLIDATERHETWSVEELIHLLWKTQLACRSLRHVTGNMQRNFYAAVQQVAPTDKDLLNVYLNSSAIEDAFLQDTDPLLLRNKSNEELITRILAMSFHMTSDAAVSREDLQAFNAIIIVFELLLRTLADLVPTMTDIHEYEKSCHVNVFKGT